MEIGNYMAVKQSEKLVEEIKALLIITDNNAVNAAVDFPEWG